MGQRYPLPITGAMLATANAANEQKPRYNQADYIGGATGEDPGLPTAANQAFSTANVAVARDDGGANEPDYTPRNQNARRQQANMPAGTVGVVDIGRNRGQVAPGQRYPLAGDTPLAAPVVSSISPTTAAAGSQPVVVTITGTGFSPYSRVVSGGSGSPWDSSAKYLSATTMTVVVDPRGAVAGTAAIAVEDHGVLSNVDKVFTFT